MHRIAWYALALSAIAGAAAPPHEDWLVLDRELEELSKLQAGKGAAAGFDVAGYLKADFAYSPDVAVAPGGNDLGGLEVRNIRVSATGQVGDCEVKVSLEGASGGVPGNARLRDTYARFPLAGDVHAQVGSFKSPFLFSALASNTRLVFFERTTMGATWGEREPGVQIDGGFEPLAWYLAAHNGGDGSGEELLLVARLAWAAIGAPISGQEGGYGPDAETALTLGLSYLDDRSAGDAGAAALEAMAVLDRFWLQGEIVDIDDGFAAVTAGNASKAAAFAGSTPWSMTGEVQASERWGFALRYDHLDDADDTRQLGAGINWYAGGHATKWQLDLFTLTSDDPSVEADRILLGLTAAL